MSGDSMDSITRLNKAECAPYRPLISAECDGDLTASERAHLYAHLESCADCRERRDAYRLNALRLQRLEHPDSPATLKVALFARLGLDPAQPPMTSASADSGSAPTINGVRPKLTELPPLLPLADAPSQSPAPISLAQRLAQRNARMVRVVGSLAAVFVVAAVVVIAIILSRKPAAPSGFDNQIAASVPQKGAVNVPTSTQISLTFRRPVREETIAAALTVNPTIGYQIWWNDHKTVLIVPSAGLVAGQTYTIHVDGGKALYADGTPLGEPIDLMFVTVGPNTPDPTATPIPPTPTSNPTATAVPPTATIKPTTTPVSTAAFGSLPSVAPTNSVVPSATSRVGSSATATVAGTRVGEYKVTTAPVTSNRTTPTIAVVPTNPVAPTATQAPVPTNTAVPTATQAPAPTNTAAPTVTTTAEATATVEPTVTVAPTATIEPTITVAPTNTAAPTSTAVLTITAAPTEIVTPPATVVGNDDCAAAAAKAFGQLLMTNNNLRKQAGCPSSNFVQVRAALQQFQNGTLYLDADNKRIYVMVNNIGIWRVYADLLIENNLRRDDDKTTPDAGYNALRSFGKLLSDHKEVRAALGAATTSSHDFVGIAQTFDNAQMLWSDLNVVYVLYTDTTFTSYFSPTR